MLIIVAMAKEMVEVFTFHIVQTMRLDLVMIIELLIKIDQLFDILGIDISLTRFVLPDIKRVSELDLNVARLIKQISSQMLAERLYYILPSEGKVTPNVSHINNGCCVEFTERLLKHINGEYMWHEEFDIPHAFVFYNGRYYDSESPYGVSDWKNLPIWKDKFSMKNIND